MSRQVSKQSDRDRSADAVEARHLLWERAFSRTAGAALITGNRVRLLLDAEQNYPEWQQAIASAERTVHFETYMLRNDPAGRAMADLLIAKVAEGIQVRLLYDWFGALGATGWRFWHRLRSGGVEARCCNPPRLHNALAWSSRDHRKLLTVDGKVGFVSGLCVAQEWLGFPERGIEPWRDTGVELRGPAVADLERAFADNWSLNGEPLNEEEIPQRKDLPPAGNHAVRVIPSSPESTGLLRLDLLWAAIARKRLWLADAYFIGTPAYIGALCSAAQTGVDVRLLVPSASNMRLVAAFSRIQYRTLLEAGVRVFEWSGPMMHAKTAVVDGVWSRVGSTNLNVVSWIVNWELDVCVEDPDFGQEMEAVYRRDLEHATEMVLNPRRRVQPSGEHRPAGRRAVSGSAGRAAAAALQIGTSFGVTLTQRGIITGEARAFAWFGILSLMIAAVVFKWPKVLSYTAAVVAGYVGVSLLARAYRLWRQKNR
ncbi:MAG: phospholipase D-like domain-containing protein [Chloroflexi bacterium]|nr:phospholipase D-like domain-containing protein [Chloroflexota bacterium]